MNIIGNYVMVTAGIEDIEPEVERVKDVMRKEAEEFLRETGREHLIDKVQVLVRGENRYKGDPLAGVAYPKRVIVGWKVRDDDEEDDVPLISMEGYK